MSTIVVQVFPNKPENPTVSIYDNGYQTSNFNLFSDYNVSGSYCNSTKYIANVVTSSINKDSKYTYNNTITSNPSYTTSYFTTSTTTETSFINFTPENGKANIVNIIGNYNSSSQYSTIFSANQLEIIESTDNVKLTYFNFYNINTTKSIGTITYNPSENSYTAHASNSLDNYQNLVLLSNNSIVHYTNYPNNDVITPLIFDAMFAMNSYAFERLFNNNLITQSIEIDNKTRYYTLINIDPNNTVDVENVLLCFPGGNTTRETFIEYTGIESTNIPAIVFLGQESLNKYTWQNAFPWLYKNDAQNDVTFIDTVLEKFVNVKKIFLTGKSDGEGFSILYSVLSKYNSKIKAIGVCSGAYFGLDSDNNISDYDPNNCYVGNYGTIIPYNIILPPKNVSLFIFHGTRDTIMPYDGQNCTGIHFLPAAKPDSLWKTIDTTLTENNGIITTNTYTVNIPDYFEKIKNNNNLDLNLKYHLRWNESNVDYSYSVYSNNNNNVLNFITLKGQMHCWSGHYNTGIGSSEPYNFYMDATYLFIKFLKLDKYQGNYIPTVNNIPQHLLTYTNESLH